MNAREISALEHVVGLSLATVISIIALYLDGFEAMIIAGGSAAAAAGVGSFVGFRST